LNSLELPLSLHLSSDSSHWDAVRQIYRRMSVLRATGHVADAEVLETSYQQALTLARRRADSDTEEAAILAAENERVASAVMLADLLVPLLAERLGQRPVPSGPTNPRTVAKKENEGPAAADLPTVTTPPRPADGGVPGIADLIDGMLAQESPRAERSIRR
jgi:hypothetical protein